jgi:hypothetical protein
MDGPYDPLWLTYEYSEYSQVNSSYYYCLSPTPRYLYDIGTQPNRFKSYWKIPCGIAQRNIKYPEYSKRHRPGIIKGL